MASFEALHKTREAKETRLYFLLVAVDVTNCILNSAKCNLFEKLNLGGIWEGILRNIQNSSKFQM